jgi:diguanylate cyclase (GGDEF)-like protein
MKNFKPFIDKQLTKLLRLSAKNHVDSLTGVLNKHALEIRFIDLLDKLAKKNQKVHLLLLDLNRFKQINGTLGHKSGDILLTLVAQRLVTAIPKDCIVGRMHGDEFAIIVPDITDNKRYIDIANLITKKLATPFTVDKNNLYVSAGIGISTFPTMGNSPSELCRQAEIAMYIAKRTQRDYVMYNLDDDNFSLTDLTLVGEIKTAIDNEEFVVWYQPKKNLKTNDIDSVECLVRWNHPVRGIMPPSTFIPISEQSGMIKYLTHLVIKEASLGYSKLRDAGYDLSFSINISPNDIVDPAMMTTIIKNVVNVDMDPSRLVLEVTETAFMHDPESAFKVLVALELLGINLSIDDFGVGYSSLIYLKNFPITELKFDKSFISDIETSKEGFNIVKSNIELAHVLGATTVGEGVETESVETLLREIGCDYAQGYYIAKPMPINKLITWMKERKTK